MPTAVDTSDPSCFVLRAWGELTLQEVRGALELLRPCISPHAGAAMLGDGLGLEKGLTLPELALVATDLRRLAERGLRRLALVAPTPGMHEQSRVFASFASLANIEVKAFRLMAEAREWLLG